MSRDVQGVLTDVEVDLMVPAAVAGGGRRAADLLGHARHVARKARGLEAALVDKSVRTIAALDPGDARSLDVAVAGPAALLVSKLHKLEERLGERGQRRLDAKDALDILRLLRSTPTDGLATVFATLRAHEVSGDVTSQALVALRELFGTPRGSGAQMAAEAAGPLANPEEVAASCAALAADLLNAVARLSS